MTVAEALIKWLEDNNIAVFGQDLFLRRAPNSLETPDAIYWVIPSGGSPISRNYTGEMVKQYSFLINYRSTKAKDVEKKLFELEELINCQNCFQLEGYEVQNVEVSSFPDDGDLDEEYREVGLLQVNIQTYKQRC